MKQVFLYLLLLFGIPALAQKNTKLKINLTSDSSRRDRLRNLIFDTVRFYKQPGERLSFKVPIKSIGQSLELKRIPVGTYRVTYKNLFMESTMRQVNLLKKHINEITLYMDSLDSYPQNTLAMLQDKDSILLQYRAVGCGDLDLCTMIITRNENHFVARLYRFFDDRTQASKGVPQSDTVPYFQVVTLTEQQIKTFIKFENELFQLKPFKRTIIKNRQVMTVENVSTSTDWYNLKSNYFNVEKYDRLCKWNGFYWLAASIFGTPLY